MKDYINEMPRETLTVQNIRNDLKKTHNKTLWIVLSFGVLSVLMFAMLVNVNQKNMVKDLAYYVSYVLAILVFVCTALEIIFYIRAMVQLKRKITIVTDWLVDMREDVDLRRGMYHRYINYTELTFAKYGKFRLHTDTYGDTNYPWSKMYAMSNQGVCNYSNINDEFYLVISNDKKPKILKIYNQKLFELR